MNKRNGPDEEQGTCLIVISALDPERLKAYAKKLLDFVSKQLAEEASVRLTDLAFTLQVGREAMPERVGFPVSSLAEFRELLERLVADDPAIPGLRKGRVTAPRDLINADRTSPPSDAATRQCSSELLDR